MLESTFLEGGIEKGSDYDHILSLFLVNGFLIFSRNLAISFVNTAPTGISRLAMQVKGQPGSLWLNDLCSCPSY